MLWVWVRASLVLFSLCALFLMALPPVRAFVERDVADRWPAAEENSEGVAPPRAAANVAWLREVPPLHAAADVPRVLAERPVETRVRPAADKSAESIERAQRRLAELGAAAMTWQREQASDRECRFTCDVPLPGSPAYRRRFAATGHSREEAIQRVLVAVESWRLAGTASSAATMREEF